VLGFVPTIVETWDQQGAAMSALLDADFAAAYRCRDPFRVVLSQLDVERQLAGRDPVNQSLYLWAKTALPNYILSNLGDRMEMAHSVEGRLPLLDHHVAAHVARMPIAMKINGMTEKFVLREAARSVLTDAVYKRQKHPFSRPRRRCRRTAGCTGSSRTRSAARRSEHRPLRPQEGRGAPRRDPVDGRGGPHQRRPAADVDDQHCILHERLGVS